jgi:predicted nuclease of predicted toxin-antitoxin system
MLRLMSDADVHGHIIRGVRARNPGIDLVRVQEVGLRTAADPVILERAALEHRIVITQDRSTMIGFARERIVAGVPMPGLFVLRQGTSISQAIDELLLVDSCSEPEEWRDRIEFLPL